MIKNVILSIIFFVIMLSIPYIVDAGVIVEPRYQSNQLDWIDPNSKSNSFQEFYVSEHGLVCENQIYQIYHLGTYVPARKCQLPDGAWITEQL